MSHYFDESPAAASAVRTVDVSLGDVSFELRTDSGVFSHGRLDAGTAVLLRSVPPPPTTGTGLDLGCGTGAIAIALGLRAPALRVWAVDVNERARQLCERNASANSLANVVVAAPDDVPADERFDVIWSNPPIRIGKAALHELLRTWLDRLTPTGRAHLVVHRHLGADSLQRWLGEHGHPTDRLASAKGYRILTVPPTP
jgi:16S rRNA (guanine1207-N2)-methyltransferase